MYFFSQFFKYKGRTIKNMKSRIKYKYFLQHFATKPKNILKKLKKVFCSLCPCLIKRVYKFKYLFSVAIIRSNYLRKIRLVCMYVHLHYSKEGIVVDVW